MRSGNQRACWLGGWLLGAIAPTLFAQATVEVKVPTRQAFAGEAVELSVEVRDFQECDPPVPPELTNATLQQLGGAFESSNISIINGRRAESHTRSYRYELVPLAPGELVLGPFKVNVDGRELLTREVRLTVRASDADKLFAVEVTIGRKRLYLGQRVQATLTVWVKPPYYGNQPVDPDDVLYRLRASSLGPFLGKYRNVGKERRVRSVDGKDVVYYAYEFPGQFIAEHLGPLRFDDLIFSMEYVTSSGPRHLRARPTVEPVEVLPVPMEGRPADFNGAVGLFDIAVKANPTSVRVGDPVELAIELFGDGPVETLPPPLLSANARLVDGFRVPGETLTGEFKNARRRFAVTVRPKRADLTEIPPIDYPYFDPDAERFVVAHSHPIPLTVSPAAEIEAPERAGADAAPAGGAGSVLQALDGLHDVETSEIKLLTVTHPLSVGLVTGVMFAPAGAFLIVWAATAWLQARSADPARRRRAAALRTARERIRGARGDARELAAEVAAALAGYLGDRLDDSPARFAGRAGSDYLRERGVRGPVVEQWAAVLARCEEASFGSGAALDADALRRDALAGLAALEREKL